MNATCAQCGNRFQRSNYVNASEFCSAACRVRSRRGGSPRVRAPQEWCACIACGKRMRRYPNSAPVSESKCRGCRRGVQRQCPDCGGPCSGETCRPCRNKRQVIRATGDHRVIRKHRESAAPGIRPFERAALLAKWKRQGKACAYCPATADTIDHVVPLVRGGTNYEGNLAPCCKPCNSRKGGRTVVEWRTGKRLPRMNRALGWAGKAKPIKPIKGEQVAFNVCICGVAYLGSAAYCSSRCHARSAYRLRVGIPLDVAPYAVRVA